jgi:hypothetical protein
MVLSQSMQLSISKHISEHYPYWRKLKYSKASHTHTHTEKGQIQTTIQQPARLVGIFLYMRLKHICELWPSCFVEINCINVQHMGLDFRIKYVWNNGFWNYVSSCLIVNGRIHSYSLFGDKRIYIYWSRWNKYNEIGIWHIKKYTSSQMQVPKETAVNVSKDFQCHVR